MKIKSLYIDGLHNAVNKTYTFKDINYIFGNNGIGKSTILQAIQFALLGYIPGTPKNSRESILRHSPKNWITVRLELCDCDDETNKVHVERFVNKTTSGFETIPSDYNINAVTKDLELPIFNFNEFVGQTANKLKEYFIKNILPTSNGDLDWENILSDSISDCNFEGRDEILKYGMSLIAEIDESEELLNQVIQANAKFKNEQSFNKSEIQRLQNTIDSLIYYDDYSGPTDLSELNSNLLSLNALRDQLIRYSSACEATKSASEELAHLNKDIEDMGGQLAYDELNTKLPKLKQEYNELSQLISNKQNALSALRATDATADSIIQSKGLCPYTNELCKSISSKIEDIRNESAKRKVRNLELSKEIEEDSARLNELHLNIRKCESHISDFMTTWNRVVTFEKTMQDLPQKPNTDKTVFELDQEIALLSESKNKLEANNRYNETINNITKLKYEAELKGQALSNWVKKTDTNGLQTTLMIKPFDELAEEMTKYIKKMYRNSDLKAHFNISNKTNSFSFGLVRYGIYIPYDMLSSGEKCSYSLALMICIINSSNSTLKLLMLDDAFDHLDSTSIENTFATLKTIPDMQFILAGVKECSNAQDILITV